MAQHFFYSEVCFTFCCLSNISDKEVSKRQRNDAARPQQEKKNALVADVPLPLFMSDKNDS